MKYYITTLGRLRDQVTLRNLSQTVREQTIMVVQDHEWRSHQDSWGAEVAEVRALPPDVRTLGPTRRTVVGWAEDSKVVLLDDDLNFYARRVFDDWHLTSIDGTGMVTKMFEAVEEALDRYAHVGVSGREGNNRVLEGEAETTRYMRLLAYRLPDAAEHAEHGRVDGMSDFDVNLQLLQAGLPSLVFYGWAQGQRGTQTPGGCAISRTHATHEAEIAQMVRWHRDFVSPRTKINKTGGDFGTRTELTIQWKKALEAGIRARAAGEGQS